MLDLVLLRHGQSTWNAENLFTGLGRRRSHPRRARRRPGPAASSWPPSDGPGPAHPAHLGADPGHPDGRAGPGGGRAQLAARCAVTGGSTSATTGTCRGRTRPRSSRSSATEQLQAVAPQLRHPAPAALARTTPTTSRPTPATATSTPRDLPRTECLEDVVRRIRALLGVGHRARPARRRRARRSRAGGRPRQFHPGPAQAPRAHRRRRHRRSSRSRRASPSACCSTTTSPCTRPTTWATPRPPPQRPPPWPARPTRLPRSALSSEKAPGCAGPSPRSDRRQHRGSGVRADGGPLPTDSGGPGHLAAPRPDRLTTGLLRLTTPRTRVLRCVPAPRPRPG